MGARFIRVNLVARSPSAVNFIFDIYRQISNAVLIDIFYGADGSKYLIHATVISFSC